MPHAYTATIRYQDGSAQWEESLPVPAGIDPRAYIRGLLEDFNEEEIDRYGDKARLRELVSVDTTSGTRMCSWTRVNAVTLADRKGLYNRYRCDKCRLTVRTHAMARPAEKECHPERVCTICNKEFASDTNLARHMARKHAEE